MAMMTMMVQHVSGHHHQQQPYYHQMKSDNYMRTRKNENFSMFISIWSMNSIIKINQKIIKKQPTTINVDFVENFQFFCFKNFQKFNSIDNFVLFFFCCWKFSIQICSSFSLSLLFALFHFCGGSVGGIFVIFIFSNQKCCWWCFHSLFSHSFIQERKKYLIFFHW